MNDVFFEGLPEHLREQMYNHIQLGWLVEDDLLLAILTNDLGNAIALSKGDFELLASIQEWLLAYAPSTCYGSDELVFDWEGLEDVE